MEHRAIEPLIDSHCHLDFADFKDDLAKVIAHAQSQGVVGWVVPGVTLEQSRTLLDFKQRVLSQSPRAGIYLALGLHPYFLAEHNPTDLDELAVLIQTNRATINALGECGLDSTIENMPLQQQLFHRQIQLANDFQLPLIVHHRQSHHLIAEQFKREKPRFGGIIHAFSGSLQQAQYYLSLGFKLGIGGTITYERAAKTKAVVSALPLASFVLETDAPSMPLFGYQGKRNEPERLVDVFQAFCALRTESQEDIARALNDNLKQSLAIDM